MGAVRTAGRGSEVEASAFLLSAHSSQGDPTTLCSPPDVERTLTVGREAILEDSLEDVLTRPMSGTSLWIAKIRFASTAASRQTWSNTVGSRANDALLGR